MICPPSPPHPESSGVPLIGAVPHADPPAGSRKPPVVPKASCLEPPAGQTDPRAGGGGRTEGGACLGPVDEGGVGEGPLLVATGPVAGQQHQLGPSPVQAGGVPPYLHIVTAVG